jgi:hypothetical protein
MPSVDQSPVRRARMLPTSAMRKPGGWVLKRPIPVRNLCIVRHHCVQTGPGTHPASYTVRTGCKATGASAEVLKLWTPLRGTVGPLGGYEEHIYIELNVSARQNIYFVRHCASLKYFT